MGYFRDLDEYADVELVGEIDRRKTARARGLCDYCSRPMKEESCRFPLRHRPAAKIEASGSGLSQPSPYAAAVTRLAKCVGFWLDEHPDTTVVAVYNSPDLDARAEKCAPGYSGGMWAAAVIEAFRHRDEGTLHAWLGVAP